MPDAVLFRLVVVARVVGIKHLYQLEGIYMDVVGVPDGSSICNQPFPRFVQDQCLAIMVFVELNAIQGEIWGPVRIDHKFVVSRDLDSDRQGRFFGNVTWFGVSVSRGGRLANQSVRLPSEV